MQGETSLSLQESSRLGPSSQTEAPEATEFKSHLGLMPDVHRNKMHISTIVIV